MGHQYSANILVLSENWKYSAGLTAQTGSWVEALQFYLTEREVVAALPDLLAVCDAKGCFFPSTLPFLNLSSPQPQPAMSSAQIRCAEPREVALTRARVRRAAFT